MARLLLDNCADKFDLRWLFANTGQEHEETLRFVDRCDKAWGMNIVWLEAEVVDGQRKASGYRVVSFDTASRDGRPFEDVIRKYGIPNKAYPHCTRELKANPMAAYAKAHGAGREVFMAIGLRADEIDRIAGNAKKKGIIYPLISMFPTMKYEVNAWWDKQPFTLNLPEHHGNCLWCWKKSGRKHGRLLREMPGIYEFPARMEREYGMVGVETGGGARVLP